MKVVRYHSTLKTEWNKFVELSKNGTFLHNRNFMEYHADRFEDWSVLVLDEKDKILAIFPANVKEKTVYSHQGLTYGGLLLSHGIKIQDVLDAFETIKIYYKEQGLNTLIYKASPSYYHTEPAFEESYLMFLSHAETIRCDTGFCINLQDPFKFQERRKRSIKKGAVNAVVMREDADLSEFWNTILIHNLKERHGAKPIHTLEEIQLLKNRFPKNILQYNAYLNGEIVAGTTLFVNKKTVHTQYISSNEKGRKSGALDFLISELITKKFAHLSYFSFGTANQNEGKVIDQGLADWKEGFGAQVYPYRFYKLLL